MLSLLNNWEKHKNPYLSDSVIGENSFMNEIKSELDSIASNIDQNYEESKIEEYVRLIENIEEINQKSEFEQSKKILNIIEEKNKDLYDRAIVLLDSYFNEELESEDLQL